ncbi:Hypothetical protein, conserved [Brucella canis ATCC 23365]|uniref:Uncharacterized protein n=2 Tax=Brucella TaxID=234 RepID=A9MCS7_BRUC2|nr:Hypothetical protein, conserved [Brucella canis ATCC 23365]EEH12998.1 Hypothetical protein, conserved [Brucella ceti str. Cudo]
MSTKWSMRLICKMELLLASSVFEPKRQSGFAQDNT